MTDEIDGRRVPNAFDRNMDNTGEDQRLLGRVRGMVILQGVYFKALLGYGLNAVYRRLSS